MVQYNDLFNLQGKVSIITGGTKGLGREMATALAQSGSNIVIADLDEKTAKATAEEIKKQNEVEALGFQVDVTQEDQVQALIQSTIEHFGKIDVVINNAGICQKIKAEEMSLQDWNKTMEVNVNGVFLVSKLAGKEMMETGGGSIINIASMSSFIANTEAQCAYNSSKAAVVMMTKCLANEWVSHNIRVNAIAPGYMETDMAKPLFAEQGELRHVLDYIPMKRLGKPYELGGLAIFLASDASSYSTGSTFVIDGGYTIQ
ncbi:3-oxoacyl-[acyl-carrier protein] reductase [Halalkalibacter wakoensis JCM 9140]|uniref:3-oxoacyl-[acyl-carrier protein] reductase n=1 Tax=Halalkalibacter wakoensis JCM 9140 TaxID=1236970 RepID=W4Q4C7_9BACI|nr:glucose 1-dehydrogenase [Halalkalibacter wakoensis]GAE26911.1 3-oxoacyl-[acyl-carrier protein] reductase [Halalkalibacter wakoensis JCM 9140]